MKHKIVLTAVITALLLVMPAFLFANVRLPHVLSSNMVLQRNMEIKIWGWADKGEKIAVTFAGQILKTKAGKAIISFSHTGSGLTARDKYGYVKGFAIAGPDKQFHWAQAVIKGDNVVVNSDKVANPVAVRYAWADNPDDANLYNKEGLPASPFRTDDWKGLTEGRK